MTARMRRRVEVTCADCVGVRGTPLVLEALMHVNSGYWAAEVDPHWRTSKQTHNRRRRKKRRSDGYTTELVKPSPQRVVTSETATRIDFICPRCHYGPVPVSWRVFAPMLDRLAAAGCSAISVQALKRLLSDGVS